jgi:phage-related protein
VAEAPYRWYWRRYRTPSGGDPVGDFLRDLPAEDRRALTDAMRLVRETGVRSGRHLRRDLYEVRAQTAQAHYRLIFCQVSRAVMLAMLAYDKNTEKTPRHVLELAQRRLGDWRERGKP